jgi:hypothetical protein
MANPKQKAEAVEDIIPVLTVIKNQIQKRQSFDDAMAYFRIDDESLRRDLWRTVKDTSRAEPGAIQKKVRRVTQAKVTVAEQHLLELLIFDRELQEKVLPILEETDYEHLATGPLFLALYSNFEKGVDNTVENLLAFVGDDEFFDDLVPLLMMTEPKREEGEVIDEVFHQAENCILTLRIMAISNRIIEISQEIIAAEQVGNHELAGSLVMEQLDLARMKHDLLTQIKEI